MKAYRQFAQSVYGSIQRLNAEWGSIYKDFDDLEMPEFTQLRGMADIPRKHLWMSFCEKGYADMFHQMSTVIKEIDASARVGAEGSPMGDPKLTLDGLEMWGP